MPTIGGVYVPDNLMPRIQAPETPRPGLGAVIGAAAQGAYGQVRYGLPLQAEKLLGTSTPEDEAFYQQGLAAARTEADKAAPASVGDLTSGRAGFGRFVGENLAASLPYMAGSLVGGIGGALAGGPGGAVAGAIAAGVPQFSASNVDRAVQEQGSLTQSAAQRALAIAPLQAASDVLVERYLPGAGHVIGDLAASQVSKAMGVRGFLTRTAKSIVKAGATEAVTEAGQQLGERYAAGLPVSTPDAAAEYVNAAVTAFAVGGVLGAGGGIRRTPAHIKPAADVTPEDLNSAIDTALNSSTRATALQAPEQQLGLDLPGGSAAEVQPSLPFQPEAPQDVLPSQLPQLPLDPVLSQVLRGTQLELGDRFTDNVTPVLPQAIGATQITPQAEAALAAITPGAAPGVSLGSQASPSALAAAQVQPGVAPTEIGNTASTPRLFADNTLEELNGALKAKDASPEVRAEAEQELLNRRQEAAGNAPLTGDFKTRLDELKDGLRGSFVTKLDAENSVDLVNKIYTEVFENSNTASSVQKLAQRAGLLDTDGNATPLAAQMEAQRTELAGYTPTPTTPRIEDYYVRPTGKDVRKQVQDEARARLAEREGRTPPDPLYRVEGNEVAPIDPILTPPNRVPGPAPAGAQIFGQPETIPTPPAPPAVVLAQAPPANTNPGTTDPAFAPQWEQLKRDAGIQRLRGGQELLGTPTSLPAAQAQVFRALASDSSDAQVSQVEKLARKMGLVTDDENMDVTPLGRQAFLSTPEGLEETVSAAQQQGYTGKQASIFDRGVKAHLDGRAVDSFTSFDDMAAYQAGQVWAKDFVENSATRTAAQTGAIQARQGARVTGRAVDRERTRAELTPGQVQQRGLNQLIDAADMTGVKDVDAAALRRMVRDGASPQEVGEALQRVQGGKTLFREPPSAPVALSPQPTRGQPIFKEMNKPEADPAKAQRRVENETAVQAYDLRNLVEFALNEGGITQARADKLNTMLDEGKTDQVKNLLKDFDPDFVPAQRRARLPTPPERVDVGVAGNILGQRSLELEQALTGKSFNEVADHLITKAQSRYHREVMRKVLDLAKEIQKTGTKLEMRIVRPGDTVPARLNQERVRAITQLTRNPNVATVWLKSSEMGPSSGMNAQIVMHEMLHAVTMKLIEKGSATGVFGETKLGKATKDLFDLQKAIAAHFNARAAAGNLSPFEQEFFDRTNNALGNVDEILAWGMTNPAMQRYLNSIEYKPRQSVFAKLVDLLRNLLGLTGNYDNALTELLRVSEQILGTRGDELVSAYGAKDPAFGEDKVLEASAAPTGISAANRTVDKANSVTQDVAKLASNMADQLNIDVGGLGVKARRAALGWQSITQLVRSYGRLVPGIVKYQEATDTRAAVRGRFAQMGVDTYRGFEKLQREQPKQAERVSQLMELATVYQVDPDKAFVDHTHLANDPRVAELRALHTDAVNLKNTLSRGDAAGIKAYNDFKALNEAQNFARMAASLHNMVASDPELAMGVAGSENNPVDAFMLQPGLSTPDAIRAHWEASLGAQLNAATAFVGAKRGSVATASPADQRAMGQHLSPVEMQISAIHEALAGMKKAPYFHLGRFGDNFGSASIRADANGVVDPVAQKAVAEALEKAGFGDARIAISTNTPKFSMRFDTVDQTRAFRALMLDLQRQGIIGDTDIKAGPRDVANNFGAVDGLPAYVSAYIQRIESSPMFVPAEDATREERGALAARKEEAVRLAVDSWLEQQPDSSIAKVLAKRYTVPGYNPDMVRSWAHRWDVGSVNIANVAAAPKINDAYVDMRSQVNDALVAKNGQDPYVAQDVLNEIKRRDATQPINVIADTFDKLRAVGHAYFLGFSLAYAMINMTQVGVTALPELAKQHGYTQSFHALRRATPQAWKIMKAAAAEAWKLSPKDRADLAITESALKAAGVDDVTIDFVRRMQVSSTLDIGTSARALGQVAKEGSGSKLDTALKYAGAFGLYTETFSRLLVALAAKELHGGSAAAAAKYAQHVVNESMFNYSSANTARQLGKQGFAGPITPLLTQFMSYSVQITEKLYSEFRDAVGKSRAGESADSAKTRRREAQRFLAGHLTAVTALAGTLGMPFASVFASVLERVVDSADGDDDPFDATAAWRGFLADVLGKDVAEVVSRGLPRAIGLDISQRAGEADLLPFSQLISDRRSWRESIQGYLGRSIGASPNMLLNVAEGGEKFSQGDVLGGMKAFLPTALKGPVEAYRMTEQGYVDTKGSKLPMTPQASAYLAQLLGFTPSAKAEYSEARGDQQARRAEITQQAQLLRSGIVKAMMTGDRDRASDLVTRAIKFDQDNPAFAVIPSLSGSIERQVQAQTQARALRSPIGVSMQDIAGQRLTDYANVGY